MATDTEIKENNQNDSGSLDNDTLMDLSSAIEAKKNKRQKEKNSKKLVTGLVIAGSVVIVCSAVYLGGWASSMGSFLPNTYINDVDVSKLNLTAASAAIQNNTPSTYLNITKRDGSVQKIELTDFDYKKDIYSAVKSLYDNIDYAGWIGSNFKNTNYYVDTSATYDNEKLIKLLKKTVWGTEDTKDAKIMHGQDGFYVQPEVYGDTVDTDILIKYVTSQVAGGNLDIDITDCGCYSAPKIFTADLEGKIDELNASFNYVVTLDFDYAQEVISGADVYEWANDDGTIDRNKVYSYVERLADKYDTFMTPRKFRTTAGNTITIDQGRYSTGQYGWWMDKDKTTDKLMNCFNNHETLTMDPEYVQLDTGYCYVGFESGRTADSDIGNTYIEVDLSNQKMWYYENGEVKFQTDQIVSGKASDPKRKTPPGIYSVYTKNTNYTMRAADGSYTAKCKYFMRISFEGIGFHDYSRSAYGGNIYLTNGSHGCMNMKLDEVKTLFDMVERGTPVILYY